MKSTGIVRKVDELGRIVLPKELRRTLDIRAKDGAKDGTPLEIFIDGESIILRKYQASCIFCGEAKDVQEIEGKKICTSCIEKIKQK